MEGRVSLAFASALIAACSGCVPDKTTSGNLVSANSPTEAAAAYDDAGKGSRPPKPTTFVAVGNLSHQDALDTSKPQAERDVAFEKARKSYQQALVQDPKNLAATMCLARLYDARGDYSRAVATYKKATELQPKEAGIWHEFGMCQARHKDWDDAIKNLRKGVDLDPEDRQHVTALGFTLARSGRFDEAYEMFRKSEGEARAHYNVARMLHHVQRDEQSKEHLRLALKAKPDYKSAQDMLAALEDPRRAETAEVGGLFEFDGRK